MLKNTALLLKLLSSATNPTVVEELEMLKNTALLLKLLSSATNPSLNGL